MALPRRAPELLGLLLCLAAATTASPQNTNSTPPAHPAGNCPQAKDATAPCPAPAAPAPGTAQQFPFPGDSPSADDPIPTTPAPGADRQPAPAPAASGTSSGPDKNGKFPYPGDPDSSSSGSSSSSSSSSSSGSDDLPPDTPPEDHTTRRKLPKVTRLQSDDEREAEDIKVAKFYHDDGNYLASYNRLKDAVSLVKDDPDAWYLLAQTAGKLGKTDESQAAWKTFLTLEPDTRRAREARHALTPDQAHK